MEKIKIFLIAFAMISLFTSPLTVNYVQDAEALKSKGTPHPGKHSAKVCGDQLCSAIGKTAPEPPQGQVIKPASEDPDDQLSLLFIQTAKSGTFVQKDGRNILTLVEISPLTVWFSDRPQRATGSINTDLFYALWNEGEDSFADDPPNAALEFTDIFGNPVVVIVELTNPVYSPESQTFQYDIVILGEATEGLSHYSKNNDIHIPRTFGYSTLFIDNWFEDTWDDVKDAGEKAGDAISDTAKKTGSAIKSGYDTSKSWTEQAASTSINAVTNTAKDVGTFSKQQWENTKNTAKDAYDDSKEVYDDAKDKVNEAEQKAKDAANELAEKTKELEQTVENTATDVTNSVLDEINDIIDEITSLFGDIKKYVIIAYSFAPMVAEYSATVAAIGAEFTADVGVQFFENAAADEDARFERLKYIVTHLEPVTKETAQCFADTAKAGYQFDKDTSTGEAAWSNLDPKKIFKRAVDSYHKNNPELANAATCSLQIIYDVGAIKDADSTLITQGTFIALDRSGVDLNETERNSIAVSVLVASTIVHVALGDVETVGDVTKKSAKIMAKQTALRGGVHALDNVEQTKEKADRDVESAKEALATANADFVKKQSAYSAASLAADGRTPQPMALPNAVFAVGPSNNLVVYENENWNNFGGWIVEPTAIENSDGSHSVFAVGNDNRLWKVVVQGDKIISDWESLGGWIVQPSVAENKDGEQFVFAVGKDNALWYRSADVGWESLGGWIIDPIAMKNKAGTFTVFAVGGDNAIWYIEQDSKGTWSDWKTLDGWVVQPDVVYDENGDFVIFAVGGDAALWYRTMTDGWKSLSGGVSEPTAAQNQDGSIQFFVVGGDNALWHRSMSLGWGSMHGWIVEPTVTQNEDGTLQVYATGGDNQLWTRAQTSPNSNDWSGWTSIGLG